ncbi:hypothetical protein HY990_00110 [Candidatus Micrarchaeota archaeon]|nr:hypothetical protein [Candidatus Micrarchaeota archaeon]
MVEVYVGKFRTGPAAPILAMQSAHTVPTIKYLDVVLGLAGLELSHAISKDQALAINKSLNRVLEGSSRCIHDGLEIPQQTVLRAFEEILQSVGASIFRQMKMNMNLPLTEEIQL